MLFNKKRRSKKTQHRNRAYYSNVANQGRHNDNVSVYSDLNERRGRRAKNVYMRSAIILTIFVFLFAGFIILGINLGDRVIEIFRQDTTDVSETTNVPTEPTEPSGIIINGLPNGLPNGNGNGTPPVEHIDYHGVYIDLTRVSDIAELEQIVENIVSLGFNGVVIDIKRHDGVIPFEVRNVTASIIGAVQPNENLPIADVMALFREYDLVITGRVSAFRDTMAVSRYPDRGLRALDTNILWRDAEDSMWLNVYSEESRDYITDLISEVSSLGFSEIVLEHFHLPFTTNPANIVYNDNGLAKYEVVTRFVNGVKLVLDDNVRLGLKLPLRQMLEPAMLDVMGINVDSLIAVSDFVTMSFAPADIPGNVRIDGANIIGAEQNITASISSLARHFASIIEQTEFRPMLQAYPSASVPFVEAERLEQIEAVNSFGINQFWFFSRNNSY